MAIKRELLKIVANEIHFHHIQNTKQAIIEKKNNANKGKL